MTNLHRLTVLFMITLTSLAMAGDGVLDNVDQAFMELCLADPMGGTGGGPISGTLTVTVVEAGTTTPIAGAFVMVGTAPDIPFQNNVGVTDGSGTVVFTDDGLQGAMTVTAGAPGYHLFTFFEADAAEMVIPLQSGDSTGGTTYFVGDDIVGIDVDNGTAHYGDGYIDVAFVMPALSLDAVTGFDLGMSFADMEIVTILGQQIEMPSNIYIPQQWEIFMEITKDSYHVNLPAGDHTLIAVSCRIALSDLQGMMDGSGDFMDLIPNLDWREIDALELTVTGDTVDADFNMEMSLDETVTLNYSNIPADSALFAISLGDLDDLNGLGRLTVMGVTAADCVSGPCSGSLSLSTAETTGIFSGTGYFPAAAVQSNETDDLSAVLIRDSHPRTYTANISQLYGFLTLNYDGETFTWSDAAGSSTGLPDVAIHAGMISDIETGDTLWTYLVRGDTRTVSLPELPASTPISLLEGQSYSWGLVSSGLGFGSEPFYFDDFSLSDITDHLSHVASDSKDIVFDSSCDTLGCTVSMPAEMYRPGDTCWCMVTICNPGTETYSGIPVFVILDVYGNYYFAPSFSDFDRYLMDIVPGESEIEVLPEFLWPTGAGSASGIVWYAAMTNPEMTALFGAMDTFAFGWSE